jgi:sodium/bile acid cotransporter 7
MLKILKKYWFLIGILFLFVLVLADSTKTISGTGIYLKKFFGLQIAIVLVFFLSGMIIDSKEIRAGFKDIKGLVLAFFLIFVAAPSIAFIFSRFNLSTGIITGIFLVAVMPTTLSSGVVMTGSSGGNMAHALMITIFSNIAATFTIPFTLALLMGANGDLQNIEIDKLSIIIKIGTLVVLPLLLGMFLKSIIKINSSSKSTFQILNQIFVLILIFMALSEARADILSSSKDALLIFFVTALFHGLMLFSAFLMIRIFGVKKGKSQSVIFMGGQKTLPLSLLLQVSLFPQFGAAIVVCVCHHMVHLIMDSYIVGYMNKDN